MNFLFVDRILSLQPGERVLGIKHVTPFDMYLSERGGQHVLMTSILGEALGQLGAWAAMKQYDFNFRPVAGTAGEVEILGDAPVGSVVLLDTQIHRLSEDGIFYNSVASVNDKPVFKIKRALGPMLPMTDFIDPDVARLQFDMIYRPGDVPTPFKTEYSLAADMPSQIAPVNFDHIVACVPGEKATAIKHITLNAPYFIDHFPRKPVFPLTMLLECKLCLAYHLLFKTLGANNYKPVQLKKIKMRDFVQPGQTIKTDVVMSKVDDDYHFEFTTECEGKVVCTNKAVFTGVNDG